MSDETLSDEVIRESTSTFWNKEADWQFPEEGSNKVDAMMNRDQCRLQLSEAQQKSQRRITFANSLGFVDSEDGGAEASDHHVAVNESTSPNKVCTVKLSNFASYGKFGPFRASSVPTNHLFLESAPNLLPFISRWEIKKFENC
jgi:hypothetical protein